MTQKSPSAHHRTTLSGYIFARKAFINNRKNLSSSNISPTCLYNMVNFGPLAAEIGSLVCGTSIRKRGLLTRDLDLHLDHGTPLGHGAPQSHRPRRQIVSQRLRLVLAVTVGSQPHL